MRFEHIAIDVSDPEGFMAWWCKNLGLRRDKAGRPFIIDDNGMALEVYRTDKTAKAPDYGAMDVMTLHFAFDSEDVKADSERLVVAGATLVSMDIDKAEQQISFLRDPWGVTVQFCCRRERVGG